MSFRREKYVPKGGPDGGDGGKGGDVIFIADRRYYNLSYFFKDRLYKAQNGQPGQGRNMYGKNGVDEIVPVPPGTQILDEDGDVLADLIHEDDQYVAAVGGMGGKGNTHFKSSTQQTPQFAQPGISCEEIRVTLDLKLIADIGLVGLPNAGKSTLLAKITNARPKIGNYPFTTLSPNLGVIEFEDGAIYTMADIPGIIEGAHKGLGLGLSFLQHIERVKVILYLIDLTGDDLFYNLQLLQNELSTYNEELLKRPHYLILTKSDLLSDEELEEKIRDLKEGTYLCISSETGSNIGNLLKSLEDLMEKGSVQKRTT